MSRRSTPRVVTAVAGTTVVLALIGAVIAMTLNAFVFDDYAAYGEVPIPGTATVHLIKGPATVSLHTVMIGGRGTLPIPKMSVIVAPPDGVPEPVLTEDVGGTTTVNNDAHVRIWKAQIPATGDYEVTTKGSVSAYVNPTLAFGHDGRFGFLPWAFGGLAVLAGIVLAIGRRWARRIERRDTAPPVPPAASAEQPWVPTDQNVRIEQLNTLARLRDSGALTDAEFEAEKKRVLDGY